MQDDPLWAGFFSEPLMTTEHEVQQFFVLLYQELQGPSDSRNTQELMWMQAIHRAAPGDAKAQAEILSYGRDGPEATLF